MGNNITPATSHLLHLPEMEPGILVAYIALLVLAVVPIYIGSWDSIKAVLKNAKKKAGSKGDSSAQTETLSSSDAYMFPLIGSCVLFGLYIVFKLFEKEYVNYLLTAYFACVGTVALAKFLSDRTEWVASMFKLDNFSLLASKGKEELFSFDFTYISFIMLLVSLILSVFYVITKNWILSNIFGFAFSANGITLMQMDSFKTGIILLSGLFLYDIFWVFGTEVMVSVAKNFDAPVKMLWPKELSLWNNSKGFSMLGLGDIVIPGIYVALCLRYDFQRYIRNLPRNQKPTLNDFFTAPKPFFKINFLAYIIGLVVTVVVMHTFQAAQPALLYLSPACIISSLATAISENDLSNFLAYTTEAQDEFVKELVGGKKSGSSKSKNDKSDTVETVEGEAKEEQTLKEESKVKAAKKEKSKKSVPISSEEPQPTAETQLVLPSEPEVSNNSSLSSKKKKNKKTKKEEGKDSLEEVQANKEEHVRGVDDDDMVVVVNKKKNRRLNKKKEMEVAEVETGEL